MIAWEPSREWTERTNVWRFMRRLGFRDREEFLCWSRDRPEEFWREMMREAGIQWFEPYRRVMDLSRGPQWAEWFIGGKLNVAWNCLDRHPDDAVACIWEGENGAVRTVTFGALRREAARVAGALRARGLHRGDRVALVMPMVPEVAGILYGCLKLGLVVVPIFAGFGSEAIAARLEDSGARAVFTADALERRGRMLPLKDKIPNAAPELVVVLRYKGTPVSWNEGRDVWWEDFLAGQDPECGSLAVDSEERAFILYTSGTTGRPKGAVHTHAGCLAQMTKEILLAFDHQPADRFFWLSDIGWMMGPWSLIGNHNFGGTVFLYDGAPDYPGPDRLWQIVERHGITTLGISPTAVRMLMREGAPERYAMRTLRLLGSTGEPWDEKSWRWYFERVGKRRCPVINISGGTEIVGCFLFPLPIQALKPCSLGAPAPGMATEVFDEDGRPVRGRKGYLVATRPAPSMTRGLWGDPKRYLGAYWSRWPGVWYHGDWASVDEDGHWFLHGRADETMNVAGRMVGPGEVESALMRHPEVAETAVVGAPDEVKGEAIVAFVVPRPGAHPEPQALCAHVAEVLGAAFRPREAHLVDALPKTQSGKVLRRLLRKEYLGEAAGDVS